jgi:hypothetical protein
MAKMPKPAAPNQAPVAKAPEADLPSSGPSVDVAALSAFLERLTLALETAAKASNAVLAPSLFPSPAEGAAIDRSTTNNVDLKSTTHINVSGAGDPGAVGNVVAGKQSGVNAEIVRNIRGAVK